MQACPHGLQLLLRQEEKPRGGLALCLLPEAKSTLTPGLSFSLRKEDIFLSKVAF